MSERHVYSLIPSLFNCLRRGGKPQKGVQRKQPGVAKPASRGMLVRRRSGRVAALLDLPYFCRFRRLRVSDLPIPPLNPICFRVLRVI